jgi:ubiquinone/menaquinone biosynthesis C-methylase UbiE
MWLVADDAMVNYGPASKYYDLFGSKEDIAFYRELAVRHGRKALELGLGTGRVAIELAKAGVAVWGIDNSKYMLAVARQKLRREDPVVRRQVKLKLGDMRLFKLKETFPFAYIASSTFEHCVTEEDQQNCLTSVYEALESGGVLAFDISRPSKEKAGSWYIDRKQLGKEIEVVRTIFSRLNPQTKAVSVNLFFDVYRKGMLKERYYEYGEAKLSSKEEVEKMLKTVGFTMQRIYGNFDKSAYSKQSQRIIFVCGRP